MFAEPVAGVKFAISSPLFERSTQGRFGRCWQFHQTQDCTTATSVAIPNPIHPAWRSQNAIGGEIRSPLESLNAANSQTIAHTNPSNEINNENVAGFFIRRSQRVPFV